METQKKVYHLKDTNKTARPFQSVLKKETEVS